jgi:hypothetical protein
MHLIRVWILLVGTAKYLSAAAGTVNARIGPGVVHPRLALKGVTYFAIAGIVS